MNALRLVVLVLALGLFQGCAGTNDTCGTAAPPPELVTLSRDLLGGWQTANLDTISRIYANDALVITPQGEYRGEAAIRSQWIPTALQMMSNFDATPEYFTVSGDAIAEVGRYSFRMGSPDQEPRNVAGVYTHTWRRQSDGTWRITRALIE